MSGGKSGGSSTSMPALSPEQNAYIAAQTKEYTGTIAPSFTAAAQGATNLYNQEVGGVTNAAQNLATTAGQAQEALGGTGESALRTGSAGMEN